jgi:hypothetical protein
MLRMSALATAVMFTRDDEKISENVGASDIIKSNATAVHLRNPHSAECTGLGASPYRRGSWSFAVVTRGLSHTVRVGKIPRKSDSVAWKDSPR